MIIIIRDKDTRNGDILGAIKTATTTAEDVNKIIPKIWTVDGYDMDTLFEELPDDCEYIDVSEVYF